jgi:hypothetical protein
MVSRINENWVFGKHARLNFSTPILTAWDDTLIDTSEGCACISDASGTLLLYTDGQTVRDGAGNVRASGLEGNPSSTQSAIIVPDPGNTARYYVFTADGTTGGNNHLNGRRIDTGTWIVEPLSSLMTMPDPKGLSATERVTAIQHRNCRDFWVLTVITKGSPTAGSGHGIMRVFLVTAAGVQHVADTPMKKNVQVHDVGYLKGSPDGGRIALANWQQQNVLVFSFDNASGAVDVTGMRTIPVPTVSTVPPVPVPDHPRGAYGVEFAPTGSLLYYSVLGGHTADIPVNEGYVFQHDLSGAPSTSVLIGTHQNTDKSGYALGALQLGMDGRIYIAQDGEAALGVIANPSVPGPGCGLTFGAVQLPGGARCYLGLPNLIANPCGCPCEEGNCDHAVDEANRVLNGRAERKTFTIPANGQPVPAPCRPAFEQMEFGPLFSLHWGDGAHDQFESHDTEVVYIQVRNPYRNLAYRGVKIFNIRVTPNQALPDGDNALQLVPAEIVCFEGIEPCSYVSRDFAFLIQNAIPQGYQITFEWCIEEIAIVTAGTGRAAFDIDVVAS